MSESWPLSGSKDADATDERRFVGDAPARASGVANLRRGKARDFDAFVDDGHLFQRNAGLGENSGDPFGDRQNASGGAITRAREVVFFEREADAARNEERNAAMGAREPSGGDAVGFVGVDESELSIVGMKFGIGAAGAKELGNF